MKTILISIASVLFLVPTVALACEGEEGASCPGHAAQKAAKEAKEEGASCPHGHDQSAIPASPAKGQILKLGTALSSGAAVSLEKVLAAPDTYSGKSLLVEGQVRKACAKMGCWMELAPAPGKEGPGARVTFKDGAFFVPRDSAGSMAKVEGTLQIKALDKAAVAHLEKEGAKLAKKSDGTATEVAILASGVELVRQ